MKLLFKNKHWDIVEDYNIDKILYLLIDRPTEITLLNELIWRNNIPQTHRDYDLPAFIWNEGKNIWWYTNNKYHRENGKPKVIWFDGMKKY